jgi:hypothetical protein
MCSQNTYDNVVDFKWYLSVLVDLAYVSNFDIGTQIRDQLVDVVGRVRAARSYAVKLMVKVLSDDTFLLHAGEQDSCSEVLWAAAWICGEYCRCILIIHFFYHAERLYPSELSAPDKLFPTYPIDHNFHIPSASLTFHNVRPNDWNECGTTHTTSWTTDLKSLLQRMSIQYPSSD